MGFQGVKSKEEIHNWLVVIWAVVYNFGNAVFDKHRIWERELVLTTERLLVRPRFPSFPILKTITIINISVHNKKLSRIESIESRLIKGVKLVKLA